MEHRFAIYAESREAAGIAGTAHKRAIADRIMRDASATGVRVYVYDRWSRRIVAERFGKVRS